MTAMTAKPRALSLAQSTGDSMHLGNYLGALRQWVGMQDEFEAFFGVANSDIAFRGNLAFQGNFNGTQVWDIANPASPTLAASPVRTPSSSRW